jgi:hypothetical protein
MIGALSPSVVVEDAWEMLPAEVRAEFLERRAAATKWGVSGCQTTDSRRWEPLRPVIMHEQAYRHLEAIASRLLSLAVESCRYRASTLGELRDVLKFHNELPLLDPDRPLISAELIRYARPDFLIERGRLRLLEFNNSTRLGGGTVTPRLADAFAQVCPEAGLYSPPNVVPARSEALVRTVAGKVGGDNSRRLLIPTYSWRADSGEIRRHEKVKRNVVLDAKRVGFEVIIAELSELRLDSAGRVLVGGLPIDLVLIHWGSGEASRIVNDGGGLAVLRTADRAGTVTFFPRTESTLIASKVILAWMHEDAEAGRFDRGDQDLVRTHVPRTISVGLPNSAPNGASGLTIDERDRMIFKPAGGKSGTGVVFGKEMSDQDWRLAVGAGVNEVPAVVQELVQPDRITMQFIDQESRRTVEAPVPFVLSPFMIDGAAASVGVRHLGPDAPCRDVVISVSRGARSNAVVLTDRRPVGP